MATQTHDHLTAADWRKAMLLHHFASADLDLLELLATVVQAAGDADDDGPRHPGVLWLHTRAGRRWLAELSACGPSSA
jgi:hypothetical protein